MNRRGNALAGVLVAVAIVMLATVAFLVGPRLFAKPGEAPASPRPDGKGTTVVGQVKYAAKDEVCRSNLNQVRMAIQVAQTSGEESLPPTIDDLRLGTQFSKCPVGGEPYTYDPAQGTVACAHPGHERY